jgi:ribosomal protein S18 acetylase RimI-like enzyme
MEIMLEERALTLADVPAAFGLSTEVHWNQSPADWEMLLELGRGFALLGPDGAIVATAVVLPYELRFAWIGTVIVTEAFRRRGLATRLLNRCIATIVETGAVPILDATPAGREVYTKLGFLDTWELQRYAGTGAPVTEEPDATLHVRRMTLRDLERLLAADAETFGADRSALLRRLFERKPEAALVAERLDGMLAGMAFERVGRTATQIGPVAADDANVALALIAHAVSHNAGALMVDVPVEHTAVNAWLEVHDFSVQRPFTRMQHAKAEPYGRIDRTFAIAGPEIG